MGLSDVFEAVLIEGIPSVRIFLVYLVTLLTLISLLNQNEPSEH